MTTQAVKNFQSNNETFPSGTVSADTRVLIEQQACGTSGTSYTYSNTDYTNTYTSIPGCAAGYSYSTITGQSCYINNSTYMNSIPGCYTGYIYSSLTGQLCSTNTYNTGVIYPYNYNNGYNVTPIITSILPTSGAVGSSVIIYGTGFTPQNNTVYFGTNAISNIPSFDGTSITVTVPVMTTQNQYYSSTNCIQYSTYNQTYTATGVSVRNANGYTSNSMTFNVSGTNCSNYYGYGAPVISNVTGPTTLSVGTSGVWTFTVQDPSNSYVTASVRWGDENVYPTYALSSTAQQSIYANGQQVVSFTHTYQASGYYTVVFTVSNSSGQQNTSTLTVNVTGSGYGNTQPVLSYISPAQGRVGTQVILQGTGFASYGNTVHFGLGGLMNVSSTNGTTIYYTIPYSVSECNVNSNIYCTLSVIPLAIGSYPVYVSTPSGQTNTLYFNVTSY
jgi:hypothetical protein